MDPLRINGQVLEVYSYIVFPYKKYGDIVDFFAKAQKLNKNVSFKLREYICLEMLKCILVLHDSGYAHVDIKPDNFIINDDLTIALIDFGYVQPINKSIDFISGTKKYLAPEFFHTDR